jgi:hypothetical protein
MPTLALGLYSQYGPIEINIALKESPRASDPAASLESLAEV